MDINGPGFDKGLPLPHGINKLFTAVQLAFSFDEIYKQFKFGCAELQWSFPL